MQKEGSETQIHILLLRGALPALPLCLPVFIFPGLLGGEGEGTFGTREPALRPPHSHPGRPLARSLSAPSLRSQRPRRGKALCAGKLGPNVSPSRDLLGPQPCSLLPLQVLALNCPDSSWPPCLLSPWPPFLSFIPCPRPGQGLGGSFEGGGPELKTTEGSEPSRACGQFTAPLSACHPGLGFPATPLFPAGPFTVPLTGTALARGLVLF